MLEDYANKNGYTNILHFTDDGYSGGSFERPAWKKLIEGVENIGLGWLGVFCTLKTLQRVKPIYCGLPH